MILPRASTHLNPALSSTQTCQVISNSGSTSLQWRYSCLYTNTCSLSDVFIASFHYCSAAVGGIGRLTFDGGVGDWSAEVAQHLDVAYVLQVARYLQRRHVKTSSSVTTGMGDPWA